MANLVPLYIDKDTGNIVATTDTTDIIPLYSAFGFVFTQTTASDTWIVLHNKETMALNFQVFSTGYENIIPDSMTIDNPNQITIKFNEPMTGVAHLILFKTS